MSHRPPIGTVFLTPLFAAVLSLGCGQILGADEYGAGDAIPEPPDTSSTVVDNPCVGDEVLTDTGECEPVGVRPEMCSALSGFEPDPKGGCRAVLPEGECETGVLGAGSVGCGNPGEHCDADGFPPGDPSAGRAVYVDAAAPPAGTGARENPFRTIAEALELYPGERLYLSVRGTFHEDVAITRSNVTLRACPGAATIEGQEAVQLPPDPAEPSRAAGPCFPPGIERLSFFRQPAVCVAPGVHGVTLEGLTITGKGDGVQILGATGVTLSQVRIRDTGAFGLRIVDAKTDAIVGSSVTLDRVSIYKASGAGILVAGSTITVDHSSVQHTVPINDWADLAANASDTNKVPEHYRVGWARGITIHPGWWPSDKSRPEPETFLRSVATIRDTVLTGNKEMALFAAGATVNLERAFLGSTPGGTPSGRGIVAERSLSSGVQTEVQLKDSVIQRATDAAIDIRDATVLLERTTIRDTLGRLGDGCSGQGIRARTLPTGDVRTRVEATDSTIIGARQAGIFAASSTVELTRVLIRDVAPDSPERACAAAMGDGIALETFSGQDPADAMLDHVRIENASRAGIMTTGPDLEVHSTLLACSGPGLVDGTGRGRIERLPGAVCGCGATWSRCERAVEPLASWILSGPSPVWPGAGDGVEVCAAQRGEERTIALAGGDLIRPEIPLLASGANGCLVGTLGLRGEITAIFGWRPGYGAGMFSPRTVPAGELLPGGASALSFTTNYLGFPIAGSTFVVQNPPVGSRLVVTPKATIVGLDGNVLPEGRVTPGNRLPPPLASILLIVAVPEPGWYTLEVVDLPDGVLCQPNPRVSQLGADTRRSARFARAEWGIYAIVEFEDCASEPP